jgi:hypothetical protein
MVSSVGSGIGGQVGLAAESTFGTAVTPTRFLEVDDFKGNPKKNTYQSGGLAAGLLMQRGVRRVVTSRSFGPTFSLDVLPVGFGLLLRQLMGSTAAPVQQAATAAYLQTHTLSDVRGIGATIQAGEPSADGVVNPYTYFGAKLLTGEFTQEQDKGLKLATTWDARDRTEATALASASFSGAAQQSFHWGGFAVKAGVYNSEAVMDGQTKATIKIDRKQNTGRFYANDNASGYGLHKEPILNDRKEVATGTLSSDFVVKADLRDRFISDAGVALMFQWTGDLIASTFFEQLTIRFAKCFFNDDGTGLNGDELLSGDFPWVALDDGVNPGVTITYMSVDTAL